MAFKMKGFPKADGTKGVKPKKVKVFGGRGTVDVSTKKGRDLLKEIKSIPTTSSSEKGRIAKVAKKVAKGAGKIAGKALMGGVIDPTNKTSPRLSDRKQFKQKFNTNKRKTY